MLEKKKRPENIFIPIHFTNEINYISGGDVYVWVSRAPNKSHVDQKRGYILCHDFNYCKMVCVRFENEIMEGRTHTHRDSRMYIKRKNVFVLRNRILRFHCLC